MADIRINPEVLEAAKERLAKVLWTKAFPTQDWEAAKNKPETQYYWRLAEDIVYSDWATDTRKYWIEAGRQAALSEIRDLIKDQAKTEIELQPIRRPKQGTITLTKAELNAMMDLTGPGGLGNKKLSRAEQAVRDKLWSLYGQLHPEEGPFQ